jgi:hypothetical protein
MLMFTILVVIAVCIVFALAWYIPWPPPIAFMRWLLPVIALLVVLVLVLQKLGVT